MKYQTSEVGARPLLTCGEEHALAGETGTRTENEDQNIRGSGLECFGGGVEVGARRIGDPISIVGHETVLAYGFYESLPFTLCKNFTLTPRRT